MTNSIRTRVGAALAIGALVALSACSGSDQSGELQAQQAQADNDPDSGAANPALQASNNENSQALGVTGDALPPFEDPTNDAGVGMTAPVVTGVSFDGTEVTLGGPTSGPTMLVFLAHWCPHCNAEIPEINTLRDAGELPADLNIIGVSTAVQPDRENFPPSGWIVEKDWTWPVLADTADSEAMQLFGGTGFPFTVMLNADGSVNARKSGSATADQIRDWIDTTLLR